MSTTQRVPARTVLICVTVFAMATEAMVFDYLKYNARQAVLEETARSLGKMRSVLPQPQTLEHL